MEENVERKSAFSVSTVGMGLIFGGENATIPVRHKLNIYLCYSEYFYFGKNAGLFTLALT